MYENKRYGKMVIYVDACHSGSMFEHVLPNNINVYATTSARGDESSFACYFDELRKTYLGDHYSVNWMEDSDKEVLTNETLHQQYDLVKKETTRSHVLEFGDLSISQLHVSEFQGRKVSKPVILPKDEMDLVQSHDVPIEIVKRILLKSDTLHEEEQLSLLKKLHKMLQNRQFLSQKVSEIVSKIYSDKMDQTDVMENQYKLKNFECYDEVRTFFNDECFSLPKNEHALDFMHVLVNFCEKGVSPYRIMDAMEEDSEVLGKPSAGGKLWAVLVAGSSTWDNYRHQADICHSYQIMKNHGIPDERIIVLMTDDLAQNEQNPTPGIIINHPNGKDVYKGVPKDYTGEAVTPQNFMAVLRGDKQAVAGVGSEKVLKSGPKDHVFVYFADHGAPGIIAFPEDELSASDLNKTINYMYENKMYGKMVFYIEACESGSMFENILPDNINVYATTAANAEESSYAIYFDETRETYLGDSYSVHWMEDSDKEVLTKETLQSQFKIVKKETTESHVQEYGDMSIAKMHVSEFQGRKKSEPIVVPKVEYDAVRSRDVPIEIVKRKYYKSNTVEEQTALLKKLNKMLRNRKFLAQKVTES
ncbi:legumain [Trichonephila inaurata madagascariensis]|uniref:legumain n=1 Tax=Trichonephila inaurata madagascariensis TaxID=2747483 RepID=A0A8X7BUN6_9ARAC|nr:legumain [Trichonephila inaurata madagascariensis]